MRAGEDVARWLFVLVVVVATLGPVASPTPAPYSTGRTPGSAIATLGDRLGATDGPSATDRREVLVVVELEQGADLPRDRIDVEGVYTREGARLLEGYAPLSSIRELSHDPRISAVRIDQRRQSSSTRTSDGVTAIGAADLHRNGITGENVVVGVIDRGFRPSDPEIAANVGAYRAFDDTDDAWVHGTAVASVVADTAPDAELHLAAIGPSASPAEYAEAVSWLRASGADVIVDAGSYFGQPGDGSGSIAATATEAANDTVFVTSAGNYGQRHWAGVDDAGNETWVDFGDEQGNALAGGAPVAGDVHVALRWDDWPTTDADYDLYLMREEGDDPVPVARSATRQDGDGPPTERIETSVPQGRYYVAVHARDVSGNHRLELFASHRLGDRVANGSITTPGTAASVLTVGSARNGSAADFSSRGPVGNRTGVDLVAPDSVAAAGVEGGEGTSYAAPYVAGTAALLAGEYPSLTAGEIRQILTVSATDAGAPGPDVATGYGLVDATSADALAADRVRHGAVNATDA